MVYGLPITHNQQQPVKQQPAFIKPSEVVLMEQEMARAKFPGKFAEKSHRSTNQICSRR